MYVVVVDPLALSVYHPIGGIQGVLFRRYIGRIMI